MTRHPGAELWLADVQEAVGRANQESQKALKCESQTLFNQMCEEKRSSNKFTFDHGEMDWNHLLVQIILMSPAAVGRPGGAPDLDV